MHNLCRPFEESLVVWLPIERKAMTPISLRICAGWSESLLCGRDLVEKYCAPAHCRAVPEYMIYLALTIFTLNIRTPSRLTAYPKSLIRSSSVSVHCLKIAGWAMANRIDLNQTRCLISVYTVCSGLSIRNTYIKYGNGYCKCTVS